MHSITKGDVDVASPCLIKGTTLGDALGSKDCNRHIDNKGKVLGSTTVDVTAISTRHRILIEVTEGDAHGTTHCLIEGTTLGDALGSSDCN